MTEIHADSMTTNFPGFEAVPPPSQFMMSDVVCLRCGVKLENRLKWLEMHVDWHRALEAQSG